MVEICSSYRIQNYLCIVDYHSKFPVIKETEHLSANSLMMKCKIIFSEYGLPKKIMSNADDNFSSNKFKTFCKKLNIEQAVLSSYHDHSNGQVEACIIFIKQTFKNALTLELTDIQLRHRSDQPH